MVLEPDILLFQWLIPTVAFKNRKERCWVYLEEASRNVCEGGRCHGYTLGIPNNLLEPADSTLKYVEHPTFHERPADVTPPCLKTNV